MLAPSLSDHLGLEAGRSGIQGHPQLYRNFKASLGYHEKLARGGGGGGENNDKTMKKSRMNENSAEINSENCPLGVFQLS